MNVDSSQIEMPTTQHSNSLSTDSLNTAEVRLDIKKFAQLLHSQQSYAERMVFSMYQNVQFMIVFIFFLSYLDICNNSLLHICIVAEYLTLQCILPSIQL